MTTTKNIKEALQQYISEELLNSQMQVNVDDDLLVDGMVDSMGMMWLIAFIEESFEISVPLEDVTIENFRTIATIDTYLKNNIFEK